MKLTLSTIFACIILSFSYSDSVSFEEDITLSAKEKAGLDKFRAMVINRLPHDYMKEDIYLISWLKARNFDLRAAEKMLMDNLKWREEQRMDTIHQENWSDYENDYKYWVEGRDKQGRPIIYFDIGTHDVRKAVISGKTARYLRYADKGLDEICSLVRNLGEKYGNITRGHLIVDLGGFNLVQHTCLQCLPAIIRMVQSYEAHFPRCADQVIFVNTPAIFEPFLNTVRNVAEPETSRSLRIYGRNLKLTKEAMSKDFDFDQLPPSIGGTKIYAGMEEDYKK